MAKKRRLRAKNRMGVVVPYDIAAQDVTMNSGKDLETDLAGIKQAIKTLHATLGNYAFPSGKPDINFDGGGGGGSETQSAEIAYSLGQKVTAQGAGNLINMYDELTVQLGTNDNLYVIDPSTVRVTMGNVEQEDVYDEETDTIHIAVVTGDVEIEADAMTYVGYGEQNSPLAFMLDCKNRGNQSGHWIDLAGNIDFTLGNAVAASDSGVVFDGTLNSYGETDASLDVAYDNGTIEGVFNGASNQYNPILVNPTNYKIGLVILTSTDSNNRVASICMFQNGTTPTDLGNNVAIETGNNVSDFAMSQNIERYMNKGVPGTPNILFSFVMNNAHTKLTLGCARRPDHSNDIKFVGTIKAVRVYSRKLSALEQTQNWKVDKKRFNLS